MTDDCLLITMLKLIHVQARLSVNKGLATIKQMRPDVSEDYQRAAEIIAIFEQAQAGGLNRDALDARLNEYIGTRLDYREIDGLAKVIADSFAAFEPDKIGLVSSGPDLRAVPISNASGLEPTGDVPQPVPVQDEKQSNTLLTAWRLAAWHEAARPEFYPFGNVGLTVALKPGIQSLRRAAASHDEDLLARLLPQTKRAEILQNAAANCGYKLETPAETLNSGLLFSDLPGRHRLTSLTPSLNVENLLNRYNIELLRGVLYLAPRLRILVRDKYKDLFKFIKLFGLMHDLKPLPRASDPNRSKAAPTSNRENSAHDGTVAENEIAGYEIVLEGASSPFLARSDRRYGIQFAKFLPALLLCEAEWSLEAELVFNAAGGTARPNEGATTPPKQVRLTRALYKLGPQPHLRSHFKASGEFDSLLEENFAAAFEQRFKKNTHEKDNLDLDLSAAMEAAGSEETLLPGSIKIEAVSETVTEEVPKKRKGKTKKQKIEGARDGWVIKREDRIIPVFDTVMIPDFAFEHSDGRRALLEIVGFWEPGYLERKIAKLNRAGRTDIIVLVSERTRCGRENFLVKGAEPPYQLIFFKGTPRLGPIMAALERCAR